MRLVVLAALVALVFSLGCITGYNPFSGAGNSSSNGGLGDLFGGVGDSGESSSVCQVPPEAAMLTLSDCAKVKEELDKGTCISAVALRDGDSTICEQIKNEFMMAACISLIAECRKDESLCDDRISDLSYQYTCIEGVAKAKKDVSLCNSMENPRYKNSCIETVAEAREDVSLCDLLESNSDKDDCIVKVAVAKEDESLCHTLHNTLDYWQHQCTMKVAMVKQDMGLCDKIPLDSRAEKDMAIECMENVSSGKSASTCNSISDAEFRDYYCLTPIATEQKDVSICDRITDKSRKNNCISKVAIAKKDVSLCEMIVIKEGVVTTPDKLNECVTEIAKATHNKALCSKAYDKDAQASCARQVA